VPARH
jgi:hypothetical protein